MKLSNLLNEAKKEDDILEEEDNDFNYFQNLVPEEKEKHLTELKEIKDIKLENTWDKVSNQYEEVILNVGEYIQSQRIS